MIQEQTKQDTIAQVLLDDVLKEKEKDFMSNVFPTFSYEEKVAFIEKQKIIDYYNYNPVVAYIICFIFLPLFSAFFLMISEGPEAIIYPFLFLPLVFLSRTKTFKKIIFNSWLSKQSNLSFLKNKMFKESIVSKDVIKVFVKTYGEQKMIEALVEKDHLTYADLQYLISKEEKNVKRKDKTVRVAEAIRCL